MTSPNFYNEGQPNTKLLFGFMASDPNALLAAIQTTPLSNTANRALVPLDAIKGITTYVETTGNIINAALTIRYDYLMHDDLWLKGIMAIIITSLTLGTSITLHSCQIKVSLVYPQATAQNRVIYDETNSSASTSNSAMYFHNMPQRTLTEIIGKGSVIRVEIFLTSTASLATLTFYSQFTKSLASFIAFDVSNTKTSKATEVTSERLAV